jgi:hypothetical protein
MMRTAHGAIVVPPGEPLREGRGLDGAAARGQGHRGKSASEDAVKGELVLGVEVVMVGVELRDQEGPASLRGSVDIRPTVLARRSKTAALRRKTAASGVQKISGTPSGEIRTSMYCSSMGMQISSSSPGARV